MISPNMLSYIRSTLFKTLTDRCLIEKPASTTDEIGGSKGQWTPVGVNTPCRVIFNSSQKGQTMTLADQPNAEWDMLLIVAPDQDLELGYRVRFVGETYFVTALRGRPTDAVDKQAILAKKR